MLSPSKKRCLELHDEVEFDDGLEALELAENEIWNVLTDLLDAHEPQMSLDTATNQISPIVEFSGHHIYNPTSVSQLNGNPF